MNHAADPCSDDPFCIKAENSRFGNPDHYVFVATYPGDELLIYPLMKDYCSDKNSYCAMIIAAQGKFGCESESDSSCGKSRMLELEQSSKYLNVDVWHYDLPDSNVITPNTLEQTRFIYQRIAQDAGLNHVSNYFQDMFNKLQPDNDKPLVVVSLNPYRGAISYIDNHVIRVLDESIEQAVEELQKTGRAISNLYVSSEMKQQSSDAVRKSDSSFLLCRNGGEQLRAMHADLTNFEVFKHGFYDIYPSQIFHTGDIVNEPDRYEFCLDHAKNYFKTDRNEKIVGFALTEPSQIGEVASFSNAFALLPEDYDDVSRYLNNNPKNLIPVIEIARFLFDKSNSVFADLDISPLIEILKSSNYQGPVLFLFDEPFWRLRIECFKQNSAACAEIGNQYVNTLNLFRKVGKELRKALPNTGVVHIEAFAELLLQKKDNPSRNVILLDDAEYLGYDCYGPFENCGIEDVSDNFVNVGSADLASLNLVDHFSNDYPDNLLPYKVSDKNVIEFLIKELNKLPFLDGLIKISSFFGVDIDFELNLVCDSSNSECIISGTTENDDITSQPQSDYIDWIKQAVLSLEASNPINRKIFLVPGTFQSFHNFPSEDKVIEQINAFTEVFDSSALFGGMGGFIWGDMQDGVIPFIGTRSLYSVKRTIGQIFRDRMNVARMANTPLEFHPSMSLVGAIGTRGSFKEVPIHGATSGGVYFQNADMDACSLKIGTQSQQPLTLNQLNYVPIPISETPVEIEAMCSRQQRVFTQKMRFIN